ncbi:MULTISPECIES: RidA family protein [unclassified Paenibacillus]|uniref:RidA family protein n=1 Tax=unclassified Paenibacillus TaxID=185978 RepID=UPI000954B491|nr:MULTISPECIES: RidA family protein [unclassified Paenibacillus]ASS69417.1 RidA family protein [Paenibacillus sp. RUD330]SIR28957.1 Enamine deaminase RidA, house cleaning of reactive enamine intermediates, YjgF/YER057c/UK114 family [Paenibacillus sp. RU4X]SIR41142.1 Enamine deaminase RidA, house cleaning of reactive enamine intermediates, YjgF/YER057c/UK114 family [Paenibacillus sp. RU4T]
MERKKVFTGSPWESNVGYCRAVRAGNRIEVAGTTAMKDGEVIGEGDLYEQAVAVLGIIGDAVQELGGSLSDVVRTRMYVTDISRWEEAGRAHGEFFGDVQPAATMVEVKALIDPRLLIEIEAEAIVGE